MHTTLLAAALLIGALLAVQASANLQLNKAVGSPYGAATLQLALALAVLTILSTATGSLPELSALTEVAPWKILGGLASPLYITSGILLIPRFGALVTAGLFVTGQMLASLALDSFGLFGLDQTPWHASKLLGTLAVLGGIFLIIRSQLSASEKDTRSPIVLVSWWTLGSGAGAALPIQGAINAQLKAELDAPLAVATISFTVATLAIAALLIVLWLTGHTPKPQFKPLSKMPWWGWLGGLCAATYVTGTFLLLPEIGASVTVGLAITGQQIASALIDQWGLMKLPKRTLTPHRVGGLLLLIAGALTIQLL